MCSTLNINSLLNVLKFTAIIVLPKYNSNLLLLFNIIFKQHNYSKWKKHMLELKPVSEDLFRSVLPVDDVLIIRNINSCILIGSNTSKTIGATNSWGKILIKLQNGCSCFYALQILVQPELDEDIGLITSALHYNLNHGSKLFHRTVIAEKVDMLQNFVPHIATSVKIGVLQNIDVDNLLLDLALSNYFQHPHYLRREEAFGLDLFEFAPFYYQNFLNSRLLIKVVDIQGPHYKSGLHQDVGLHHGFYVQKEYSSLIQCENQHGYSPNTDSTFIETLRNYKDNLKYQTSSNLPSGLEAYRDELIVSILPFATAINTLQLKPLFLLSGPHGVGKECVVKNVSEVLGLYLWDFDAFELQGGSPGYAEGRLKYVVTKVQQFAPCILVIKNGEVLCKDKNGNEDDRASNAFIDEIQKLFQEVVLPVIIIVTCNSKSGNTVIAPTLMRMFLHSIHMEIPDDTKRSAMIQWLLKKHGVMRHADVSYVVSQTSGYLYADLVVLLSLAIRNMYKRMRRNLPNEHEFMLTKIDFDESLNAMQEAYSVAIDAPKIPKVSWDDVGGLLDLKKEIRRTVMLPLQRPELLAAGLKRSGILLYGPPGTGKTLLAKAIATECKLNFLSVKGPELLNMYVGQSEENVREVFERARAASPCIIFFDELDSLAPNRGKSGDSGGVMDRVVSQMLTELDGLQKSKLLFVIGATNRPDLIDPALLRPGRFERLLHVGVCEDKNSQLSIMQTLTKRFKLKNDVNLEDVVSRLPNKLTGADMYSVCSQAWLIAVRNHICSSSSGGGGIAVKSRTSSVIEVGMADFREAVNSLLPSVSEDELVYYQKMKEHM